MEIQLFEHQKQGVEFLRSVKKAILADEMGLGKSRQAIVAAGTASEKGTLIVCPASLKINWWREIRAVYPDEIIYTFIPGASDLHEIQLEGAAWYIINYDVLERHLPTLAAMVNGGMLDTVIFDEAHYIKNSKTKRGAAAAMIAKALPHVYELTGTPIMNRPSDLFHLLHVLGHPIARTRTAYAQQFCAGVLKCRVQDLWEHRTFFVDPKRQYSFRSNPERYRVFTYLDDTGASNIPLLREKIQDVFLRREKKEVLDLPEKIISRDYLELSPEWRKRYEGAFDDYLAFLEENPPENMDNILLARHMVEIQKMKQVCSEAKIERILSDIDEMIDAGEKVVVFTQYNSTWEQLMRVLSAHNIGHVGIRGESSAEARQNAVDRFQRDPGTKVFVGNIVAAGVGLTLTASSTVLFADLDWTPAIHDQAEDRCHRIGQNGTVNVHYYIAKDTVEEDILDMLDEKRVLIRQIMAGETTEKDLSVAKDLIGRMGRKLSIV